MSRPHHRHLLAMRRPRHRHRLAALLTIASALLAACGGATGHPSATGTGAGNTAPGGKTRDVAFSDCMRAHGVTGFPDPTANGLQVPANINHESPVFRSAQRACTQYLPNGGNPPATEPSERAAAVAFANCMRTHGVPSFPDPALTSPRNAASVFVVRGMVFAFASPLDPKAPPFQQAARACEPGLTTRSRAG